jgi:hypothetical protein
MSTATATDEKNKKEPKLPKKPKPALVHHQPCRPRLYRLRPLCLSVVAINRAPNRNLSSLLRNTSSPEMPSPSHHATTCHRSSGQIYRTIPASRPHVRSIPSTSAHLFFNPPEIDPTIPLHFFISPPRGSCICRRSLPYHHLTCSCPGGYTDRDRANGSCRAPFDQPFFTLKLVVLRGIAGCPRCPSVHPWKMEDMGK